MKFHDNRHSCDFIFKSCYPWATCLFGKIIDWEAWYSDGCLLCDDSPYREAGLWLSLGGFQEKGPDDKHIYNSHVLLDDSGNICSVYRKIHLYTFSPSLYIFYIKYLIIQYIDSGSQGVIHNGGHSGRFDVDVPGGPVLKESNVTASGKSHPLS